MYAIKVEIHPVREGDVASGSLLEQQFRHEAWTNVREYPFTSVDGSWERDFVLDNDSRLVVAAKANTPVSAAQRAVIQGTIQPPFRHTVTPAFEDEGTNDTGVALSEQSAREFEQLKLRESFERAQHDSRARLAAETTPVQGPPAIKVHVPGVK